MNPQSIKQLIAEKSPEEALEALSALIADNPGDASLLVERGKLYWRLDRCGESISDYERAAGPAALLLEHTRAIMDFFNPDLLNP